MRNLETSIVHSALWAASGDAIGWISELTDSRGLVRRAGSATLSKPIAWRRKVGGLSGTVVELEAGTYSDDTQLRLSVSRSIRGDGIFDAEPFAKIELPVWLSYALGAGKGSKAAAANLVKRDVNWFSNFFTYDGGRSYVDAGGNGAAMRIQPHVWRWAGYEGRRYLDDVVRDSLITHGNMRGICGAIFHADCLAYVIKNSEIPGPSHWREFVQNFMSVVNVVQRDFQLSRFWLPAWEQASKTTLVNALGDVIAETMSYLDLLDEVQWNKPETYAEILEYLKAFSVDRRGTGTNTAIAAVALAWDQRSQSVEHVILQAANAIGSDTDTIATMAAAMAGALSPSPPMWQVQDANYIAAEAKRMVKIAKKEVAATFLYPDLIGWQPPVSQSDAVGLFNEEVALSGFGALEPLGRRWERGDFGWQWFKTSFGQTLLCKTRVEIKLELGINLMPNSGNFSNRKNKMINSSPDRTGGGDLGSLPLFDEEDGLSISKASNLKPVQYKKNISGRENRNIDELTELVIKSNFDARVIGDCLLECISTSDGIENPVAFSAIIAKALLARKRRGKK